MNDDGSTVAVGSFLPGRLGFAYSEATARWDVGDHRGGPHIEEGPVRYVRDIVVTARFSRGRVVDPTSFLERVG